MCQVLHLGFNNSMQLYRLGWLESWSAEKESGGATGSWLNMSQCAQVFKKANDILAYIRNCVINRTRKVTVPFYVAVTRPQFEYCIQFWAPHYEKDTELLEHVQREHKVNEKWLRDLDLLHLRKRRLRWHLIIVYSYLKEVAKGGGGLFFLGDKWQYPRK